MSNFKAPLAASTKLRSNSLKPREPSVSVASEVVDEASFYIRKDEMSGQGKEQHLIWRKYNIGVKGQLKFLVSSWEW